MAVITLAVETPNATAYDEAYPTRSQELYAHCLHEILQDMEDASPWYVNDGAPSVTDIATIRARIFSWVKNVFDYAKSAITQWRTGGSVTLAEPLQTDFDSPYLTHYSSIYAVQLRAWTECFMMKYKIYYMWQTQEDPLLLKEKLTELLIAWPLTDIDIDLNDEGGSRLRVIPAWKNVDI